MLKEQSKPDYTTQKNQDNLNQTKKLTRNVLIRALHANRVNFKIPSLKMIFARVRNPKTENAKRSRARDTRVSHRRKIK